MAKPTPLAPPEMRAVAPWRKKVAIVVVRLDQSFGLLGVKPGSEIVSSLPGSRRLVNRCKRFFQSEAKQQSRVLWIADSLCLGHSWSTQRLLSLVLGDRVLLRELRIEVDDVVIMTFMADVSVLLDLNDD